MNTLIPKHIAIIMDGNRRWAKEKNLLHFAGHDFVANQLMERLVIHAQNVGVSYMTFWAWSTENWERPSQEVKAIMHILSHVLKRNLEKLHRLGVRIRVIGNISAFPQSIQEGLLSTIEKTKDNGKMTVILALNYGGRDEVVRGMKKISNLEQLQSLTKESFSQLLDTADFPDPELIIRTGGEKRLSGFLLWQSEYSELYFTDTLMPDFDEHALDEAIEDYSKRQRRFGK